MTQATLQRRPVGTQESARHGGSGTPGALIAAKRRIEAMIQDAVWAGLLPEHFLETRLTAVIEAATTTYLSALDGDEQATAKLYVQKAAQAADEAWQQTIERLQGPGVTDPIPQTPRLCLSGMKTATTWTSQRPGRADSVRPSFSRLTDRTLFRRLKNTLFSEGAWQQVTGIEDLCHTQGSHKWLCHLDACAGSVLTPHDFVSRPAATLTNFFF